MTQDIECDAIAREMMRAPRILFVPVSSPRGSGEYARALSIATAFARKWPAAACHFVLSEEAPYARECPFSATLLPSSPTFHTREVVALIEHFRPSVIVFDNAGRTAQLRAAKSFGARIVFISSRQRQRRRAYRLRWLHLLDQHWIACPQVIAGPPTLFERVKAGMVGRKLARYLDCLIPEAAVGDDSQKLRTDVPSADHILVLTGGVADSRAFAAAPHVMAQVAVRLASDQIPVVLVGTPPELVPSRVPANLTILPRLAVTDVGAGIRAARVVVCNGGDTLVQVLALTRPCVAIAMAPDQVIRLRRCQQNGLNVQASIDTDQILEKVRRLWNSEADRAAQIHAMQQLAFRNAIDEVIDSIKELAETSRSGLATVAALPRAAR